MFCIAGAAEEGLEEALSDNLWEPSPSEGR